MLERSLIIGQLLTMFVNGCYAQLVIPKAWQHAVAAQLGKNSGKVGCAAVGSINLLDPVGKIFFFFLWGRCAEERRHASYGFYKCRRREQAILVQNLVGWRLRAFGGGHCTVLHDVNNAFPPVPFGVRSEGAKFITSRGAKFITST